MARHRYVTDIDIPNLDAMSEMGLEEYAREAHARSETVSGTPTADWLRLSARYARAKVRAMRLRLAGDIKLASRYEAECENIYNEIPKRMRW